MVLTRKRKANNNAKSSTANNIKDAKHDISLILEAATTVAG